jgi:glycosyltransferase involved in cell wall biosynthesis
MPDTQDALRILILNGDLPVFPGWGGIEYLHTTNLAQLAKKVGVVSQVHSREQHEKKKGLTDAGVSLYTWENPHWAESRPAIPAHRPLYRRMGKSIYEFIRSWPHRPKDTLVQDLAFQNVSAPVSQALEDDHWQILVVVQSTCAHWLDYLPPFPVSVLVLHDVRARVYERRAKTAPSCTRRWIDLAEAWLYRRFERKYCQKYDLVVTVSPEDEAWVQKYYQPLNSVTIPIPIDTNYFKPLSSEQEASAQILFTGMMNHLPNVDAACFFARQVFPRIQAILPKAEFWIVGRDPSPEIHALTALPGVVVTGFVPDIRPSIAGATVIVVPLRFGAGMRQKILEAWAMGKCVISTPIGAEGLDYHDGVNILIADDAQTMAEKVTKALQDTHLRDRIRAQGRNLVIAQHHPMKLTHKYYQAMASVLREKQRQNGPMRIAIDLRWMHPGAAGGIENLARSFFNQVLRLDVFNQYHVLVPPEVKYDFDLRNRPNFRIRVIEGPGSDGRKLLSRCTRHLHHRLKITYWRSPQVESLRQANALGAEVALSMPGYIHPDFDPLPNVLIVPDIQHEYCPEFFSSQQLDERRRIYTDSIRRANHLCAISEFTRQTLIERLDIPPERVTTTHLAADPMFHPNSRCRANSKEILKKYHLDRTEYLLFPGNTWPHKNHRAALQALRILRNDYRLNPLLVCTGTRKEAHLDLMDLVRDLRLEEQVRFLGYCPMHEMPAFYQGASALVFPSFFEGFGLPLLEAMWCDCPIVCSHATSLPEIAGDAALLIDPHSPEQLAAAIHRILTDLPLRRTLIERGQRRVKTFSWLTFTLEVVRILHRVRELRYA